MTLDEFDAKAGELFKLFDKSTENLESPLKSEAQMLRAGLILAIEFIADIKRMQKQFENLNQAMCSLIDLKAAEYQNGIIVKVKAPIEIFSQAEEAGQEDNQEGSEESYPSAEKEPSAYAEQAAAAETTEKTALDDSAGHGDNRTD